MPETCNPEGGNLGKWNRSKVATWSSATRRQCTFLRQDCPSENAEEERSGVSAVDKAYLAHIFFIIPISYLAVWNKIIKIKGQKKHQIIQRARWNALFTQVCQQYRSGFTVLV
jgi:hypothetical protein